VRSKPVGETVLIASITTMTYRAWLYVPICRAARRRVFAAGILVQKKAKSWNGLPYHVSSLFPFPVLLNTLSNTVGRDLADQS
jgi:hypothetical protein